MINYLMLSLKKECKSEYSDGESGSEFAIPIHELQAEAKLTRLVFLWSKAAASARHAAIISSMFSAL